MIRLFLALIFGLLPLWAVELRVATFNIETNRNDQGWPNFALGDPGGVDFDSVAAILGRIDADVVALQEVHTSDLNTNPGETASEVEQLAALLGLPYIYAGSNSGNFDTSLRVVFLSRYPFLSAESILSPVGAKEIARHCPAVVVDVPGTDADPLMISAHLKSGTGTDDRFRRVIEMRRLTEYLDASGLQPSDNFIILGDFNPSGVNRSFETLPSGLPSSYALGSDVILPVHYSTNMLSYFTGLLPTQLDPRQLDGDDGTYEFGQTLDLLLVSPGLAGRPYATEIYNSVLDVSNTEGLVKSGSPLDAPTSAEASDHYAVFADFQLDQELFNLGLSVSAPSVSEGDPVGTVTLSVSLAGPAESEVVVTLASDDSAAQPVDAVLTIPVGQSGASTALATSRNFLVDGTRSVTFSATAPGFAAAAAGIQLLDSDGDYAFSQAGETVVENFDGFPGLAIPAPWTSNQVAWVGTDEGNNDSPGGRAHGIGDEVGVGFVSDGSTVFLETLVTNDADRPLTILDVSYVAEQWMSRFGGAPGTLEVELFDGGDSIPLPTLSVDARTDLPSGPIPGGLASTRSVRVGGLHVASGESIGIRFRYESPGAAPPPEGVFINEFHYDNASTDTGEFVEIVVGPGYGGEISDIQLLLYNGSNGGLDGSAQVFDDADLGETTASGHRLFSKFIPGIQNGSPDGFALVVEGQVREFLSYEGSFMAIEGLATGLTSVDVGVAQTSSTPVGLSSIGRSGTGSYAEDFTWNRFDGLPHTPGAVNDGQSLVLPGLPSQGMAVDSVALTFVEDTDLDGLGDDEDPDDDNDGQADEYELAFGSDPLDQGSRFEVDLLHGPGGSTLSFPGVAGILYQVEWSDDLDDWDELATELGTDADITVDLPVGEDRVFVRVRAGES